MGNALGGVVFGDAPLPCPGHPAAHHPKAVLKGESTEVLDPMVKPISRWWLKSFVKVKKSWKNIGKKKWRTCLGTLV